MNKLICGCGRPRGAYQKVCYGCHRGDEWDRLREAMLQLKEQGWKTAAIAKHFKKSATLTAWMMSQPARDRSRQSGAGTARIDTTDRFFSFVGPKLATGCIEWTGSAPKGYGRIKLDGKSTSAHRLAYTILVGPFPENEWVLHSCDNPRCIAPAHLRLGDHQENMNDRRLRNRAARGARHGNAKLSSDDVIRLRRLDAAGSRTRASLAKEFGVSPKTVRAVVRGQYYGDVMDRNLIQLPMISCQ